MRRKGIMAYGTDEDRDKLAVLAQLAGRSQSEYLIDFIRRTYAEALGNTDPKSVILPH